jgi:hypothetical protein
MSETPAIYPMHNGLLMLHLENKSSPVTNPLAENANVGDSKNTVAKIMRIVSPRSLPCLNHIHNVFHLPQTLGDAIGHCGR